MLFRSSAAAEKSVSLGAALSELGGGASKLDERADDGDPECEVLEDDESLLDKLSNRL